jgi:hypothetical protein
MHAILPISGLVCVCTHAYAWMHSMSTTKEKCIAVFVLSGASRAWHDLHQLGEKEQSSVACANARMLRDQAVGSLVASTCSKRICCLSRPVCRGHVGHTEPPPANAVGSADH